MEVMQMLERTEDLHVRLTPDEKKELLSRASVAGMTLTAYLLFCAGIAAGDLLGQKVVQRKRRKDAP